MSRAISFSPRYGHIQVVRTIAEDLLRVWRGPREYANYVIFTRRTDHGEQLAYHIREYLKGEGVDPHPSAFHIDEWFEILQYRLNVRIVFVGPDRESCFSTYTLEQETLPGDTKVYVDYA